MTQEKSVEAHQKSAEWRVQVLVEMQDGTPVSQPTRDYVEGAIPKMFAFARDIRTIITITDESGDVTVKKFNHNPTEELKERAWT